jgi:hypothetical protein
MFHADQRISKMRISVAIIPPLIFISPLRVLINNLSRRKAARRISVRGKLSAIKSIFIGANCYLITYTFAVAFYLGHYSRATLKTIKDTHRDAMHRRDARSGES